MRVTGISVLLVYSIALLSAHCLGADEEHPVDGPSAEARPRSHRKVVARELGELHVDAPASLSCPRNGARRRQVVCGLDERKSFVSPQALDIRKAAADQEAAWAGKKGSSLLTIDPKDGSILSSCRFAFAPVWDGLVAAQGCLFLSTLDGSVVCLGESTKQEHNKGFNGIDVPTIWEMQLFAPGK
jgi:hypothetical protein